MGAVLVASLGKSPGVITTLVDALIEIREYIEKVVPVYVKDTERSSREPTEIKELIDEFSDTGPYNGEIAFDYENSWCKGKDIGESEGYASLDAFYKKTLEVIDSQDTEVIVGIGGGRKAMSSIMTYAAITLDHIEKIYQVLVSEKIEKIGHPSKYKIRGERKQALHPKKGQYWLVKLPSKSTLEEISKRINQDGIEAYEGSPIIELPSF